MSKKKRLVKKSNSIKKASNSTNPTSFFTFGEPVPILDIRSYLGLFISGWNGKYFELPINLENLIKIKHSSPHHESAIQVKVNILTSVFVANEYLSIQDFRRLALEFLIFGNCYLEKINNQLGDLLELKTSPAKFTRAKKKKQYCFLLDNGKIHNFKTDSILHIKSIDLNQEIYGLPEYLSCLQSLLLNEAATLFRRKYYINGSHAGFILHISDASLTVENVDEIKAELAKTKGLGNFKNMVIHTPMGGKEGMKLIPIAEVAARDEFLNLKNVSRDDILAAHRVPPQLMGIIPQNIGGFGNIKDAANVFNRNELLPLQSLFFEINQWLGFEVIKFIPYVIDE